jgi:hypothetical protein
MSYHLVAPEQRPMSGLGNGAPAPAVCPACSYLSNGQCVWCPEATADAEGIPECSPCNGRTLKGSSWWTRPEFVIPVVSGVIATVVSAVFIAKLGYR